MFLAAIYVSPSVLGVYTWAILGLSLLQSAFDVAVRQVAVGALQTRRGLRFLKRYRQTFIIAGPAFLVFIIMLLLISQPAELYGSIWTLAPLILAPISMALATRSVAILQSAGEWKALASAQSKAVMASLAISLPVVLLTQSIAGCVLQVAVVEVIFALLVTLNARRTIIPSGTNAVTAPPNISSQFSSASIYSTLGWGQGQSDRVLVGFFAGVARLGQYNLAWSVSRSLGDAIVNATINVLRPQILLSNATSDNTVKTLLDRASLLIAGMIILTVAGTEIILKPVLGAEWFDALNAVPVMALCTLPQVFSYSATIYLTRTGKLRSGLQPKMLGLVLAVPIAFAAMFGLTFAAWLAVLREVLVMSWMVWLVRRELPLKSLWQAAAVFTALTVSTSLLVI
ncbi:hypothetical protein ACIP9X_08555 [Arthrobacter sp. NPDC093125]|uniref:hypothetical protein n=1 Tax=Arthrobacter sp. NPDC093125 TaxID=3363944 RepID=UPI003815EACB